jgi:DNA transformation protein and related proteins
MQLNASFVKHALEAMASVAPISYRRIFNGIGVYHLGVQFAIILHEHLYFRASEDSRCLFEARQMPAFQPRGAGMVESFFFQLPGDVLNQSEELKYWMRIAVEAAHQGEFLDDESSLDIVIGHSRQA